MPSAASQFFTVYLLTAHPEHLVELNDKPPSVNGCSPMDELSFTHFAAVLKCRIGKHTKPTSPLLEQHNVLWIEALIENQFQAATHACQCQKACRGALAKFIGWLAWGLEPPKPFLSSGGTLRLSLLTWGLVMVYLK
jgi:hypothetical protein